jgi:hypothetical protein
MSTRRNIAILVLNTLLVIELCAAMYFGSKDPENLTPIFLKFFVGLMIPTIIIGIIVMRRFIPRDKTAEGDTSIIVDKAKGDAIAEPPKPKNRLSLSEAEAIAHHRKSRLLALSQINRTRSIAGKIAAFFLIILFILLLDSCVSRIRQPVNVINALPGTSVKVNGPVEGKLKNTGELTYLSTSPLVTLSFDELYSGFWFGGTEWSGTLTVDKQAAPAEYRLTVTQTSQPLKKQPYFFQIFVHQDAAGIKKVSKSLIEQFSGFHPWWLVAVIFPITTIMFGAVFFLSKGIERRMAEGGEAEVYWVRAGVEGTELAFGLGTNHRVTPGSLIAVFDEHDKLIGQAEVIRASDADCMALAEPGIIIRAGNIVSRGRI